MFPARSPRTRHRSQLTERDWENAKKGLGNSSSLFALNFKPPFQYKVLVGNQKNAPKRDVRLNDVNWS